MNKNIFGKTVLCKKFSSMKTLDSIQTKTVIVYLDEKTNVNFINEDRENILLKTEEDIILNFEYNSENLIISFKPVNNDFAVLNLKIPKNIQCKIILDMNK